MNYGAENDKNTFDPYIKYLLLISIILLLCCSSTQYILNVQSDPPGAGWFDFPTENLNTYGSIDLPLAEGTRVIVIANPHASESYVFSGWEGDITSTEASIEIVVNGPKTIIAKFEHEKHSLSIGIDPPNSG